MKTAFQDPGWTTRNSGVNVGFIADEAPVYLYVLKDHGIEVAITNYRARIVSIRTPDRCGNIADIVLGYSGLDGYIFDISSYLGAMVGRYANTEMSGLFKDVVNVVPLDSVAGDFCSG
jgi:aldose 1-epimerase